jgi:flagellar FliJ protein
MKRFRFGLERVLKVREVRERVAREEFGHRLVDLSAAQDQRVILQALESRLVAEERRRRSGAVAARDLQVGQGYLNDMWDRLTAAWENEGRAGREVDAARDAYIRRQVERKTLSSLQERRSAEYWLHFVREEQKVIDEVAGRGAAVAAGVAGVTGAAGSTSTGPGGR